jgi:hypothetical protein
MKRKKSLMAILAIFLTMNVSAQVHRNGEKSENTGNRYC